MKWIIKQKKAPYNKQERSIEKFAWKPIQINNEVRWLEKVLIKQVFVDEHHFFKGSWQNLYFVRMK